MPNQAYERAAKALGYRRLITYTLLSESGASLRGAGWRVLAQRAARSWAADSVERPRVDKTEPQERLLWWVGRQFVTDPKST